MSKRNIHTSEYRLLAKKHLFSISLNHILDTMYSSFSFQVVRSYLMPILQKFLYKFLKKEKISFQKKTFLILDEEINESYLKREFSHWILLQRKKRSNENPFLPTTFSDFQFLEMVFEHYFLHRSDVMNKEMKTTEATKLSRKAINLLSLEKLMRVLYKYHTPPLLKKEVPKEYKVIAKEKDFEIDVENIKGTVHKDSATTIMIEKKGTPLGDVLEDMTIGFQTKESNDMVFLRFSYFLLDSEYQLLNDRFNSKTHNKKEEAIFLLLTLYDGFGYLYFPSLYARGTLDIKEPKLNSYYEKSTILLGTPLNVPKDKEYFSLFPEVESYFGSIGSFFEAQPLKGIYTLLLPDSFIFISYCLDRVEGWLEEAKKQKRNLTFLFWYPRLQLQKYFQGANVEFESNNNAEQDMIFDYANNHLLDRLEKNNYKKEVFVYYPGKKISLHSKSYFFKIFVLQT